MDIVVSDGQCCRLEYSMWSRAMIKSVASRSLTAAVLLSAWLDCRAGEQVRLDTGLFAGRIVSNYALQVTDSSRIDEWQRLDVTVKPWGEVEVVFPALFILKHATVSQAQQGAIQIKAIVIGLGGHTSYFRPICGVRVTILPIDTPNQPPPKNLYATATFYGSYSKHFLTTEKARLAISSAIVECPANLRPEN